MDTRSFYRKDHLRQHLRLMHNCELIPSMDSWKCSITHLNSRCGFCSQTFTVWQERVDHIAKHFRNGELMKDWKGCRGLDLAVAAQVTKAMPPYLIGQEASSPIPFSATNQTSLIQCMSYEPEHISQHFEAFPDCPSPRNTQKMTCWEILTVRLGRFALEKVAEGTTPTDEMLQDYARRIMYDNGDPWNQTAADNPDWLTLFKKAHGLLPPSDDIECLEQPALWSSEELEKWGDLGLCVPLSANYPANSQAAADGLDFPMEVGDSSAFGLPADTGTQHDFDFDQVFATLPEAAAMPERETLEDTDIAFDEAFIHELEL